MNPSTSVAPPVVPIQTNGSGAAAILSAGIGSFALAILAIAGDKSATIRSTLISTNPPAHSPA